MLTGLAIMGIVHTINFSSMSVTEKEKVTMCTFFNQPKTTMDKVRARLNKCTKDILNGDKKRIREVKVRR